MLRATRVPRTLAWLLLASLTAALVSCSAHAATQPIDRVIPLPRGSFFVTALDTDHLAALVRIGSRKSVVVVRGSSGELDGSFDVPSDAVQIAPASAGAVLILESRSTGGALDEYSLGGARLASLALVGRPLGLEASADGQHAFVLVDGRLGESILEIQPSDQKLVSSIAAPAAAESFTVRTESPHPAFAVADANGTIYERTADSAKWAKLLGPGNAPAYSDSGHAIYALQQFNGDAFVTVIARPSGLPIRMFPVARETSQLTSGRDGWLIVLERVGTTSTAREIGCYSPLLETRLNPNKHAAYYFDEGNRAVAPGVGRATAAPERQSEPC